jgi:hypothetical protein
MRRIDPKRFTSWHETGEKGDATQQESKSQCENKKAQGAATEEPDFWNPKVRAPICFNPPAATTAPTTDP